VTGPDEYSAVKDNNIYTKPDGAGGKSGQARPTLATKAARCGGRGWGVTNRGGGVLGVDAAGIDVQSRFDDRLNVHPQHQGIHRLRPGGTSKNTPEDHYPLLLHYPYFQLYRKQVSSSRRDLGTGHVHAPGRLHAREEKARNFAYYEPLTVRDSSLSACTQAVIAAEVGQLDLAHDYLAEAPRSWT